MTIVRAAISQTMWTDDKVSMLDKHEQFARDAHAQEAQVICFQELFDELLVRDLDLDMVREMRDDWQFYRDRRPDSYTAIAQA